MLQPFFIWQDKVLKKIQPEDVKAITTKKNYIKIFVEGDRYYLVRSTLTAALKKLPSNLFKKIHQQLAVSINYADHIAKDHLMIDGEETPVPISRQHYQAFIQSLNIIGGNDGGKKRKPGSSGTKKLSDKKRVKNGF